VGCVASLLLGGLPALPSYAAAAAADALSPCCFNFFVLPLLLPGHIMLNRVDRRSQLKCLQTCIEMLSHGASVLFFPEGTRSKDKVQLGQQRSGGHSWSREGLGTTHAVAAGCPQLVASSLKLC
jgi:hypothetical protein